MSQSGALSAVGGAGAPIETITPNTGVVVVPDAAFNVNILGTGSISTAGAGSTLTISNTIGSVRFLAYLSATSANATGDGTNVLVIFNTAVSNVGAAYNVATGVFTVPAGATGLYQFQYQLAVADLNLAHTEWDSALLLSNAFGSSGSIVLNPFVISEGNSIEIGNSAIVSLTAGDTVSVNLTITGGTKTVDIFGGANSYLSYFAGTRIG